MAVDSSAKGNQFKQNNQMRTSTFEEWHSIKHFLRDPLN